jgi:hypothetical protein
MHSLQNRPTLSGPHPASEGDQREPTERPEGTKGTIDGNSGDMDELHPQEDRLSPFVVCHVWLAFFRRSCRAQAHNPPLPPESKATQGDGRAVAATPLTTDGRLISSRRVELPPHFLISAFGGQFQRVWRPGLVRRSSLLSGVV